MMQPSGRRTAKTVMVQGTSSHVGKSLLVTGLCRVFAQDGYRVAPFKSQNMALNSAVTRDGLEIGRAQAVQSEAAGVAASALMNPILIKPSGEMTAQIVVMGKPLGEMDAMEYRREYVPKGLKVVESALSQLMGAFDIVAIEGAGSPAEVNLKAGDIANMRVAKLAGAPVLLVADVDKGGSMAAVVGTLALLDDDERDMVKGIVINKFRGDIRLYEDAVSFLEGYTGKPVLGVVPYMFKLGIDDEDSVSLDRGPDGAQDYAVTAGVQGDVTVAVVRLPRISNFTDFRPLAAVPGVRLVYIDEPWQIDAADLVVIPGTKNTLADLDWLRASGFDKAITAFPGMVAGICGGYQMLGTELAEGQHVVGGLGLLGVATEFTPSKTTVRTTGRPFAHPGASFFAPDEELSGYEIHMGQSTLAPGSAPLLRLPSGATDGCMSPGGRVWGTYLHGLFDNQPFASNLVNHIRVSKGLEPLAPGAGGPSASEAREAAYDRWADHVRQHLDVERLYDMMGIAR